MEQSHGTNLGTNPTEGDFLILTAHSINVLCDLLVLRKAWSSDRIRGLLAGLSAIFDTAQALLPRQMVASA